MTTLLNSLKALMLTALLVATIVLTPIFLEVHTTIKALRTTVQQANSSVADADLAALELRKRIADTSQNLNAVLIQTGLAADNLRRMSISGQRYFNTVGKQAEAQAVQTTKILNDVDAVVTDISTTITNLNDVVLVDVDKTVTTAQQVIGVVGLNAASTLKDIDDIVTDETTTKAIKNAGVAVGNAAITTGNLAEATAVVRDNLKATQHRKWYQKLLPWWF